MSRCGPARSILLLVAAACSKPVADRAQTHRGLRLVDFDRRAAAAPGAVAPRRGFYVPRSNARQGRIRAFRAATPTPSARKARTVAATSAAVDTKRLATTASTTPAASTPTANAGPASASTPATTAPAATAASMPTAAPAARARVDSWLSRRRQTATSATPRTTRASTMATATGATARAVTTSSRSGTGRARSCSARSAEVPPHYSSSLFARDFIGSTARTTRPMPPTSRPSISSTLNSDVCWKWMLRFAMMPARIDQRAGAGEQPAPHRAAVVEQDADPEQERDQRDPEARAVAGAHEPEAPVAAVHVHLLQQQVGADDDHDRADEEMLEAARRAPGLRTSIGTSFKMRPRERRRKSFAYTSGSGSFGRGQPSASDAATRTASTSARATTSRRAPVALPAPRRWNSTGTSTTRAPPRAARITRSPSANTPRAATARVQQLAPRQLDRSRIAARRAERAHDALVAPRDDAPIPRVDLALVRAHADHEVGARARPPRPSARARSSATGDPPTSGTPSRARACAYSARIDASMPRLSRAVEHAHARRRARRARARSRRCRRASRRCTRSPRALARPARRPASASSIVASIDAASLNAGITIDSDASVTPRNRSRRRAERCPLAESSIGRSSPSTDTCLSGTTRRSAPTSRPWPMRTTAQDRRLPQPIDASSSTRSRAASSRRADLGVPSALHARGCLSLTNVDAVVDEHAVRDVHAAQRTRTCRVDDPADALAELARAIAGIGYSTNAPTREYAPILQTVEVSDGELVHRRHALAENDIVSGAKQDCEPPVTRHHAAHYTAASCVRAIAIAVVLAAAPRPRRRNDPRPRVRRRERRRQAVGGRARRRGRGRRVRRARSSSTTDASGQFELDGSRPSAHGIVWVRVPDGFRPGPVWARWRRRERRRPRAAPARRADPRAADVRRRRRHAPVRRSRTYFGAARSRDRRRDRDRARSAAGVLHDPRRHHAGQPRRRVRRSSTARSPGSACRACRCPATTTGTTAARRGSRATAPTTTASTSAACTSSCGTWR